MKPTRLLIVGAATAFVATFAAAPSALASPDQMGPLTVDTWDAGSPALAGAAIHVVVYRPRGMTGRPVVGVVHGASRTGAYQRVLAETLASYGVVAVVPDMPCNVFGCDHPANASQLLAMLDWAVARSADAASPIAGAVDGTHRALIGHSWGALASELAAARATPLDSLVLLDPNDDARVGATNAPHVHAPTLELLAQGRGVCNNQWIASTVSPTLGGPWLQVTVPRSGHCDPEDPSDALCPLFCGGASDRTTTPWFRRYAVAWTLCNLTGDPAMAPWIGGPSFDADLAAGRISDSARSNLAMLRCHGGDAGVLDGGAADAASPEADAGDIADAPAGDIVVAADVPGGESDTGSVATVVDGGATDGSTRDAGRTAATGTGCSCRAGGERGDARVVPFGLAAMVAAISRRRVLRRRARQRVQFVPSNV